MIARKEELDDKSCSQKKVKHQSGGFSKVYSLKKRKKIIDTDKDVGTGGHRQHTPLHFSKTPAKYPFSCNLFALLENIENAKMNRKFPFLENSEDLSVKISRGSMPQTP